MQKWWSILFGVVILAEVIFVLIAPLVGWGLPKNFCSYGPETDGLFHLILALTGIAFLATEGVLVYNLWRFAAGASRKSDYSHGNHRLEMIWTAVPAVVLLFIAFAQVGAWERIKYVSRMPEPNQIFEVSARQFEWRIRYPSANQLEKMLGDAKVTDEWVRNPHADDIRVVNQIHIWKDETKDGKSTGKVRIHLKTRDVLHSFFLPNLRIKQDAVPGKTIPVWFDAMEANTFQYGEEWVSGQDPKKAEQRQREYNEKLNKARETEAVDQVGARKLHAEAAAIKQASDPDYIWELACAELCGWGHYKMRGKLYVHPSKADFLEWLKHAAAEQHRTTAKDND